MLIQDVMRSDVIVIPPSARLAEILAILQQRGVRHVPVVKDGVLIGIVSDRDVKGAMLSAAASRPQDVAGALCRQLTAADVMTSPVISIAPMCAVEEAARLMVTKRISALPVTDDGRLVGIVTETDVLDMLVRAMGAAEPSSRLDVVLASGETLSDVVTTVEAQGVRISSLMTLADSAGRRGLAIRVPTIDPGPMIRALEARGYTVRDSWRGGPAGTSRGWNTEARVPDEMSRGRNGRRSEPAPREDWP
jgi:acetoin utilization protein AcuB